MDSSALDFERLFGNVEVGGAEKVEHYCVCRGGRHRGRVGREGEVNDRTDVCFVLRGGAGFDCVVARVVGTRGHLVY